MPLTPNDPDIWTTLAPWDKYKSELVLTVHHILTEPVCPQAKIEFEIPQRAGLKTVATASGNTVEEAIALVMKRAEVALRKLEEEGQ
tara:strand:+ start:83 stop:343 length:261 start_codon:yes stop_codon:yes gene_type:complete